MKLSTKELAKFGLFAAIIYASKVVMSSLPNIHLVTVFIAALTLVYRVKALYPVLIYILLEGLFGGITIWWIPYFYVWTIPWAVFMLLPKNLPTKIEPLIYMIAVSLHGFSFGALYAPFEKIVLGLSWEETFVWFASGFTYDIIHGISNFCLGALIIPIANALTKLERRIKI